MGYPAAIPAHHLRASVAEINLIRTKHTSISGKGELKLAALSANCKLDLLHHAPRVYTTHRQPRVHTTPSDKEAPATLPIPRQKGEGGVDFTMRTIDF